MSTRLPELIEPFRLVEKRARLRGSLPLSGLTRLADTLVEAGGEARVDLTFDRDADGRPVVTGRVSARVTLVCQRCLEPVGRELASQVALALTESESEAAGLLKLLDPLVVSEKPMRLSDIVEDELILALPIVPMHDPEDCGVVVEDTATETGKKPSPFDVLKNLKSDRRP